MSRIEEALRRARTPEEALSPATAPVPPAQEPGPDDPAADSPWLFEDRPADFHDRVADWPLDRTAAAPGTNARRPARPEPVPPRFERAAPAAPAATLDQDGQMAVFNGFDRSVAERVVISKEVPSVSVEQYRRLAATLHHTQVDRGIKIVMLTSAVTGEGKSLTATNLALTLSQSYGRRVLLIDADLRRPSIHAIFQMHNVSGLSEALKSREERKLSIIEITDRLSVLTAGRPDPDPMSGLTSDRMRRILQEATAKFDWVIIDTPPVALLPDANLLAAMVDTAVLVVGATRTPYDLVQRAVESVGRDKIIGVVLNRAEQTGIDDSHYLAYYDDSGRSR